MTVSLRSISIPDFGVTAEQPHIPASIYEARCKRAYERAGCTWLVVYADREHLANIAFLTGFDPRFEEALFLLGPAGEKILVVGNECAEYTPIAGLPGVTTMIAQTMSLMGQDRTRYPKLSAVLAEAGLAKGQSIGLVGWKYLEPEEMDDGEPGFFASSHMVDTLRRLAGDSAAVVDRTPVLMHPETGLRAIVDVHQIAAQEWSATRASLAVWRIVSGTRVGETEFEAVSRMGYQGLPLGAHTMLSSSDASATLIGLRSPTTRPLGKGDGVTACVCYWGALSARAGLISEGDDAFLQIAKSYFKGLVAWYETADIGVTGGEIHARVVEVLAAGGLRSSLNPGHLVGHDEWVHTPVRPNSRETIASGMPFQVDIIPTPVPQGQFLNCEDPVTFADGTLRSELRQSYPETFARIEARRTFMADKLGVSVRENILPMSSTPLCLAPFWLRPDLLLGLD
ncbi:Xaa-Pro aminopeptidase [Faunimonas pinastri]|uniref:Xaa-Pro aminopeptidase n=1 Tax=Faunimonas pinastri TaxID=1855383 RepID=A0A1H9DYL9_9HYPH|nr:M24 family metallopeptidase [Faunimonas pinastri]SEQ18545.1 Xaa-Pro aminopeptidase [Faunimonas pinastri]